MRDEPYNQNAVNKGVKELENLLCGLGEKVYYSFGVRHDAFFQEVTDEYVLGYHSYDLSLEQKKHIAEKINVILTLKKSIYGRETLDKLVLFEKKSVENCFIFNGTR